jgi:hypothetical protein
LLSFALLAALRLGVISLDFCFHAFILISSCSIPYISARRPAQGSPAQNVDMQMIHGLAAVALGVVTIQSRYNLKRLFTKD